MDRNHERRKEGERRKQDVLQTLAARRESIVIRARRKLLEKLLTSGIATADDVYRSLTLPAGIDPRCLGSVPGHKADAPSDSGAGEVASDRKEWHASTLSVWELLDAGAARDWLARHPDQLDDLGPDAGGSPVTAPINPNNDTGWAVAQPSLF